MIRNKYNLNNSKLSYEVATARLSIKRVFWFVAPCDWVHCHRRFEGTYRLQLQTCESIHRHIILKMKAVGSFETSGSNWPRIPAGYLLNQCEKKGLQPTKSFSALPLPARKRQSSRLTLLDAHAPRTQLLCSSPYLHLNRSCAEHTTVPSLCMCPSHTHVKRQGTAENTPHP